MFGLPDPGFFSPITDLELDPTCDCNITVLREGKKNVKPTKNFPQTKIIAGFGIKSYE